MKGIVIYNGKYGSTKQYAEWIGKDLKYPVYSADEKPDLSEYQVIIMGSAVYMGRLKLRSWLRRNRKKIEDKKLFLFSVSGMPSEKKEDLQQIMAKNIPEGLLAKMKICFFHGRLRFQDLGPLMRFFFTMASKKQPDPEKKDDMIREFDGVKKENIKQLVNDVKKLK